LARYILCCCQASRGGLRDKPSKHPDAYHSCYALAGLSACQYIAEWNVKGGEHVVGNTLTTPYGWRIKEAATGPWEDSDLVVPVHPIFVIPVEKATAIREYFEGKDGF
jgi:protein farnesyltransferase subunit beta